MGVFACLAAVGLSAGVAVADDSSPLVEATVHGTSGTPPSESVSLAYLEAHTSQCPGYSGGSITEFGRTGEEDRDPTQGQSWTLGAILECLQPTPVPRGAVTGVTVTGPSGAPESGPNSLITAADLKEPGSDFPNSAQNPVVWYDGNDRYDRPQRNSSDLNFLDEDLQGTPILIDVYEGPLLTVKATASPITVTAGRPIDFSAVVDGNRGSALSYNWNFGGGADSSTQPSPTVTFATAGVWTVNLQVTDANGGGGGDQTTVTVNQPGTSPTPTATGPTNTGPNKSTGTTPNAPASTKKHNKGTQPTGNHRTHGKGQGNNSTHTQTTTTSTTTTSTTTSQTTTTPASGGSSGGPSGSSGSPGAGASPAPTTSTPTPTTGAGTHHRAPHAPTHHPASTPAQGTLVDGELISDVVTLPADRSPLVHLLPAATAAAPARQAPESRSHIAVIAAAILAVLALLGFGAQRELGYDRQWRVWLRSLRVGG